MAVNRGKDFENVIRDAFEKVPDTCVTRLLDPTNGYLGVRNISDFIIYRYPYQYFIECKSVHGNTLRISGTTVHDKYGIFTNNQWEGMLAVSKIKGVIAGTMCWWVDKDVTKFIPIQALEHEKFIGVKSIRYDNNNLSNIEIVGKKKRVFWEYDMKPFFKEIEYERETRNESSGYSQ